jgi:membrane fusion protein (multidrug efflux system)
LNKTIIIAALLITSLFAACSQETTDEAATAEAIEVSTYTLQLEELSPVTSYSTRIKAFENAALVARMPARVLQRHVEGGETVVKGTVLVSLDPTDSQLAVKQSQAGTAAAEASLSEAQRNFDRGRELSGTGAIAAVELDRLTTALETAKAGLKAATAELEFAEVNLGYTKVTAPIDGVVGLVNVSVGDLVGPGTAPLLTITRQDTVLVDIEVSEADSLTYNQRVIQGEDLNFNLTLKLANGTIYGEKGSLFSTANAANPTTGTITVRIAFRNPDDLLISGQSATVLLSEDGSAGRMAVPQAAVQQDQRGAYVMLVGDDMTITQSYLQLGPQVDDWWLVEGSLDIGDVVVTQGLQKIRVGDTVTVSQ